MSSAVVSASALLTVKQVAGLLACSTRHIYRLSDRGAMPRPVRLGSVLVRWDRSAVESWIAGGCKSVRAVTKGGA